LILLTINLRSILAVSIVLIVVMIMFVQLNSKTKDDFNLTVGKITYLDIKFGELPKRDLGRYRYLMIEGYEYPFEVYVGSEVDEFKPAFERVDFLKPGDMISVFYDETNDTANEKVNRNIQFIDKENESYFERENSSKKLGAVGIAFCVLLIMEGVILWKMGKITF
jgi:hypothetical protein